VDNRPIGVFDSALGGLTAVRALMEVLPDKDIIYLGDTGRVPYGGRSRETIIKYARQDMTFLTGFDLKAIIVACGTVSTTALDVIAGDYSIPLIGVVPSAADRAVELVKNGKIGIIATVASIMSGAYDRMIRERMPQAELYSAACPLLVPLVENGRTRRGDILIETAVAEYLAPIKEKGVDTLVLGCTHYPLISEVIGAYMGEDVKLVSPGEETAKYVAKLLEKNSLNAQPGRRARYRYYVTDTVDGFEKAAVLFMQRSVCGEVEKTDVSIF
jgi:glutamate racemase